MKVEPFLVYSAALSLFMTLLIPALAYYDFSRGAGFEPYELTIEFKDYLAYSEVHSTDLKQENDVCLLPLKLMIDGEKKLNAVKVLRDLSNLSIIYVKESESGNIIISPTKYTKVPIFYLEKFVFYDIAKKGCYRPFSDKYIIFFAVFSMISGVLVLFILYFRLRST